jgi:hypothetical protein
MGLEIILKYLEKKYLNKTFVSREDPSCKFKVVKIEPGKMADVTLTLLMNRENMWNRRILGHPMDKLYNDFFHQIKLYNLRPSVTILGDDEQAAALIQEEKEEKKDEAIEKVVQKHFLGKQYTYIDTDNMIRYTTTIERIEKSKRGLFKFTFQTTPGFNSYAQFKTCDQLNSELMSYFKIDNFEFQWTTPEDKKLNEELTDSNKGGEERLRLFIEKYIYNKTVNCRFGKIKLVDCGTLYLTEPDKNHKRSLFLYNPIIEFDGSDFIRTMLIAYISEYIKKMIRYLRQDINQLIIPSDLVTIHYVKNQKKDKGSEDGNSSLQNPELVDPIAP